MPQKRRYADQIGRFCRRFASDMYKDHNQFTDFYQRCLDEAVQQPVSAENRQTVSQLKAILVSMHRRRLEGVVLRSGCDSPCGEELASMYHVVRRHRRARSRAVRSFQLEDGSVCADNGEILATVRQHSRALCRSDRSIDSASLPGGHGAAANGTGR